MTVLSHTDKTEIKSAHSRSALATWGIPALGAVVIAIQIFHLLNLASHPIIFIDESWNANAAWTWLQTGINFDSMHAGTLDQHGFEWLRWPTLGNLPWLASFAALGFGLFQLRLISWLFGTLLLISTFWVGRRAYGSLVGVLAALFVSLSLPFLQASHYARWDIMVAFLVMTAFGFALVGIEKERWYAHILAGLLIGLSLDVHLNGVLFAPALAAVYLVAYGKQFLTKRGTWLCALGGLLGIGFFVVVKVLPNPDAYFTQFGFSYAFTHKLPISELNPLDILRSIDNEIGRYHFYDNSLDFALVGASIVFLAVRLRERDRLLLTYIAIAFAAFVLFVGNKHDVYAILLYPLLLLAVAAALIGLLQRPRIDRMTQAFVGAVLVLFLANSSVHVLREVSETRSYDYMAVANEISGEIPIDARVMARPEWWLGLSDYDFRSNLNLTYHHYQDGLTLTDGMGTVRPDFLVVDEKWRQQLVDNGAFPTEPGFEVYNLPREEFEAFLTDSTTLAAEIYDPYHGVIEVYAVDWPASAPEYQSED